MTCDGASPVEMEAAMAKHRGISVNQKQEFHSNSHDKLPLLPAAWCWSFLSAYSPLKFQLFLYLRLSQRIYVYRMTISSLDDGEKCGMWRRVLSALARMLVHSIPSLPSSRGWRREGLFLPFSLSEGGSGSNFFSFELLSSVVVFFFFFFFLSIIYDGDVVKPSVGTQLSSRSSGREAESGRIIVQYRENERREHEKMGLWSLRLFRPARMTCCVVLLILSVSL